MRRSSWKRGRAPRDSAPGPAAARAPHARCRPARCGPRRPAALVPRATRERRGTSSGTGDDASTTPHARGLLMLVVPLIERKRDGGALTPEEWSALVAAYTADRIPDYQMSALLMAGLLRRPQRHGAAGPLDRQVASGRRRRLCAFARPVWEQ